MGLHGSAAIRAHPPGPGDQQVEEGLDALGFDEFGQEALEVDQGGAKKRRRCLLRYLFRLISHFW